MGVPSVDGHPLRVAIGSDCRVGVESIAQLDTRRPITEGNLLEQLSSAKGEEVSGEDLN
jgi:hypothetical protein